MLSFFTVYFVECFPAETFKPQLVCELFLSEGKDEVNKAMATISKETDCIKFKEKTKSDKNFVFIKNGVKG